MSPSDRPSTSHSRAQLNEHILTQLASQGEEMRRGLQRISDKQDESLKEIRKYVDVKVRESAKELSRFWEQKHSEQRGHVEEHKEEIKELRAKIESNEKWITDFKGKVALLVGAGSLFGSAIAAGMSKLLG